MAYPNKLADELGGRESGGRYKMTNLINLEPEEQGVETQEPVEPVKPKRSRTRTIEVYKDGKLIKTIEGLLKTFDWAKENEITNQGWVKRSLKTGEETNAGWKYKEGGYLFKYAD